MHNHSWAAAITHTRTWGDRHTHKKYHPLARSSRCACRLVGVSYHARRACCSTGLAGSRGESSVLKDCNTPNAGKLCLGQGVRADSGLGACSSCCVCMCSAFLFDP